MTILKQLIHILNYHVLIWNCSFSLKMWGNGKGEDNNWISCERSSLTVGPSVSVDTVLLNGQASPTTTAALIKTSFYSSLINSVIIVNAYTYFRRVKIKMILKIRTFFFEREIYWLKFVKSIEIIYSRYLKANFICD